MYESGFDTSHTNINQEESKIMLGTWNRMHVLERILIEETRKYNTEINYDCSRKVFIPKWK